MDHARPLTARRSFLGNVWALSRPYWTSEERWSAWGLLAAIVVLNLAVVGLSVLFNQWYGRFYNSLQDKKFDVFVHEIWVFTGLAAANIVCVVYALYLNQMLQIRWRRWLTEVYFANWLGEQVYYRLELKGYGTDNPDQRIAEDLRVFPQYTITLSLGLMRSVVTLFSFLAILWTLSGPIVIPIGGGWRIPGYMVWVALVYAIFGSAITHWIGRPLVGLRFNQQRYEADFRFGLVRLRENAEPIALYGGEDGERTGLRARFEHVRRNWWDLMRYTKRLTWFTAGYSQAALIFPFVVGAPRYFSGAIPLGGLIQISSAFEQVQSALSWFITAYTDLVEWKASTDRLIGFDQAIARAAAETGTDGGIREEPSVNGLAVRDLDLDLPDGTPLLRDVDLAVGPGEQVRVSGPSGAGKSTLFRAIAGIWPFGKGQVALPERSLFLPQRPYMPIGELRDTVAFPSPAREFGDEAIATALRESGLEAYAGRLAEDDHWGRRMSPGEQQRLAIARALLHRPRWLFLDEATSALDEATERRLLALLHERLPDTAIVSITHRPAPAGDHAREVRIVPRPGGAMLESAGAPAPG